MQSAERFYPATSAAEEQSIGACAGNFDLAACLAEGHRGRGRQRSERSTYRKRYEFWLQVLPATIHSPPHRKGFRRLSEVRRHHQGPRDRHLSGGVSFHRACQTLHHRRHGDRSGQDREPERAGRDRRVDRPDGSGNRPDNVPSTLYARDVRSIRGLGARGSVRARSPHADRRPRRRLRRRWHMETRPVFPPTR